MKLIRILVVMAFIAAVSITGSPPQRDVPHHKETTTSKAIINRALDISPPGSIAIIKDYTAIDLAAGEFMICAINGHDPGGGAIATLDQAGFVRDLGHIDSTVCSAPATAHEDPGRLGLDIFTKA